MIPTCDRLIPCFFHSCSYRLLFLRVERRGEGTALDLVVPLADPLVFHVVSEEPKGGGTRRQLTGAEGLVRALELLARSKLLALSVNALVVVDKVLLWES